jgi:hypothetical protein
MSMRLFARIARHPLRTGRDAREDRLTEILAAVLDHPGCASVAPALAAAWLTEGAGLDPAGELSHLGPFADALSSSSDWTCEIRTQTRINVEQRSRRPDLELYFTRPGQLGMALCIEVKHGTAPHTNQLWDYLEDLENNSSLRHRAVLLVAPRASYPFPDSSQIPPRVAQLTWERTASVLRSLQPKASPGDFLITELCAYLKEEGLMDPDRVTPEHLVALNHHAEALEAFRLVCDAADAFVQQNWTRPDAGHADHYGEDERWWGYPPTKPDSEMLRAWDFSWSVYMRSQIFLDGRKGVPRLAAGLGAEFGAMQTLDASVTSRLREADFVLYGKRNLRNNSRDRIWRVAYPDEVLAGGTLEDQGQAMGRWIVNAFEDVQQAMGFE